ncbi:MAG: succinylglutamate desuccinylase/aspartoacylase family protein [Pirellulales bacterium]
MSQKLSLQKQIVDGADAGPRLLITGGVHGDEFESMAAIRRLFTAIRPTELRGSVVLVPVVNEAAFLRGSRVADDGLDLARTLPGRIDGSITERIALAVNELIGSSDYYIDLHSGGSTMCVLPFAGYTLHPDPNVLDAQRRMAKAFNLPLVWGTTPTLQGRTLSAARDFRVPAIYAEYLGCGQCSQQGVSDYFEGCMNVMAELGMIDRAAPASRVERVIEDPRPDSGHLQVCNPAPMTGFFEPVVELGQQICVGELIGQITDPLGRTTREIRSQQSGMVILLTTFSRVLEGNSLAVILEL